MRYVRLLLPFVAILAIAGCDEFSLIDQFYVDTLIEPVIYPPQTGVSPGQSTVFVVYGGVPTYRFEVVEPGGGTIDPVTGDYTAPDSPGDFTVRVIDRASRASDAIVYVRFPPTLSISPTSASLASGGPPLQFKAVGGAEPFVFGVANSVPDDPPVGTINPDTGVFDPGWPGSVTVTVTDANGSTAHASVSVYDPSGFTLTIEADRTTIQQGESVTLQVKGGMPDYDVAVVSGDLVYPDGLGTAQTLNPSSGLGVYVASDSIGTVLVQATDTSPEPQTAGVILTLVPAAPRAFSASGSVAPPNASIELSWEYSKPGVQGFRIRRRPASGGTIDAVTIADPLARSYTWDVSVANKGVLYQFWIYAYAGSYDSLSDVSLQATAEGGQQ